MTIPKTLLRPRFLETPRRLSTAPRRLAVTLAALSACLACSSEQETHAIPPTPGSPEYVQAVQDLKRTATSELEFERGIAHLTGDAVPELPQLTARKLQAGGVSEVTWQGSNVYSAQTYVRHITPAAGTVTVQTTPVAGTDTMIAVINWKVPLVNDWPAASIQARFDVVAFNDDYEGLNLGSLARFEADGRSRYTVIVMPYGRSVTGSAVLDIQGCGSCNFNATVPVVGEVRQAARGNVFEVTGSSGTPTPDPMLFAFRVFPKSEWDIEFQGQGVFNDNKPSSNLPRIQTDLRLMGNFGQDFVLTRGKSTASNVRLQQTHTNDPNPVIGLTARPNNPAATGCLAPVNAAAIPSTLEATKCFKLTNGVLTEQLADGVIPYDVAHPFWSDGVVKERALALPNNTSISPVNGKWTLPVGGLMIKNFRFAGKLFETRFVAQTATGPIAYSYKWDYNPTRSTRVDDDDVQDGDPSKITHATKALTGDPFLPNREWEYPIGTECAQCHDAASGNFFLGLKESQFNMDFDYRATGRVANQIRTLSDASIGVLSGVGTPLPQAGLASRPDVVGQTYSYEQGRAYMDVNCAYCHNESRTSHVWKPGFERSFVDMDVCQTTADRPVPSPVLVPGEPESSRVIIRSGTRAGRPMPPLASDFVDDAGVALMSRWIDEMTTCGPSIVELRPMSSVGDCITVGDRNAPEEVRSAQVQQCVFNETHQSFNLVDDGGGFYSIKVTHASGSDCLLYRSNSEIVHMGCGNVTKAWRKVTLPGGAFELRSSQNDNVCLTSDGLNVVPAVCNQSKSHLWHTVPRWY